MRCTTKPKFAKSLPFEPRGTRISPPPVTLPGKHWTVVIAVAVLFAALGSIVVELTVARLVIVPQMAGVTVMVIRGAPPGATLPPLQVTTPPACTQVQPVPEALWKVTPGGRLSVTCTLAAVDGPPLVTVTV